MLNRWVIYFQTVQKLKRYNVYSVQRWPGVDDMRTTQLHTDMPQTFQEMLS